MLQNAGKHWNKREHWDKTLLLLLLFLLLLLLLSLLLLLLLLLLLTWNRCHTFFQCFDR